jgi:hypothetical protein
MKYIILATGDIERLQAKVDAHLALGWHLRGDFQIGITEFEIVWAQAMVLNEITVPSALDVQLR